MSNTLETKFDLSDIMNRLDGLTEVVHKSKMASLKKAGMVLKDAAMQGFTRTGLKNDKNPNYTDRLSDGIRLSRPDEANDSIKVHIMGVRSKGSGTFRLRFFETGTKERFQTSIKGIKLKKKKSVGQIPLGKYAFFESSVRAASQNAADIYTQYLSQAIERAWNMK